MTTERDGQSSVDQAAVLSKSAFKIGDRVDVTHPIYAGRGVIIAHGWLENIKPRAGDPDNFLVWVVDPQVDEGYPGVVDIIDPQYGFEERGRSIKPASEPQR
jgi:hypothetical protein